MSTTMWIDGARKVLRVLPSIETEKMAHEELPVLVSAYAVCAVAYYVANAPLLSNAGWDALCAFLRANFAKALRQGAHPQIMVEDALARCSGRHIADRASLSISASTAYHLHDALRLIPHTVKLVKPPAPSTGPVKVRLRERAHLPDAPLEVVQRGARPRPRPQPVTARHRERPKCQS